MNFDKFLKSQTGMLVIVATFVFFLTRKSFKGQVKQLETDLQTQKTNPGNVQDIENAKQNISAIKQSIQSGNKPTLTNETYQLYADNLYSYLNRSNTDESGVYRVFKYIKNDTDFMLLQTAFGVRTTSRVLTPFFTNDYTMKQFMKEYLSESELNTIKTDLKNKGLSYDVYRF